MNCVTPDLLARVLPHAQNNVRANWPLITGSLSLYGIDSLECEIAAAATIEVETAYTFAPIREFGGPEYWRKMYWDNEHVRKMLGNRSETDAIDFPGRGFVQISGYTNYLDYGRELGINLIARPDLAMNPEVAAKILARFFRDHQIHTAALAKDWHAVRRKVNGGLNGFDRFMEVVNTLCIRCNVAVNPNNLAQSAAAVTA